MLALQQRLVEVRLYRVHVGGLGGDVVALRPQAVHAGAVEGPAGNREPLW